MPTTINDKCFIDLLNQIFELEKKTERLKETHTLHRNIQKIKQLLESELFDDGSGYLYHNPKGEPYDETRSDCEANIIGESDKKLVIIDVIKPVIRLKRNGVAQVVQKAVVVVEGK